MVGDESKELPLEHKYIQLVKLHDENPLSDTPRLRTRRIVTVDGEHYHLDPDGFDENTKLVTVCASCEKALFLQAQQRGYLDNHLLSMILELFLPGYRNCHLSRYWQFQRISCMRRYFI